MYKKKKITDMLKYSLYYVCSCCICFKARSKLLAHCEILLPFSHSYANLPHEADMTTWHQRPTILALHLDWCPRSDLWCAPLHPGVSKCLRGLLPWWCDGGPKNNINTVQLLILQNSQYWIAPLLHYTMQLLTITLYILICY